MAQITQMVRQSRQNKGAGDIAYNFTHGTKVERLYVSAEVQAHLTAGRLVIIRLGSTTELVPRIVADKIAERDPSRSEEHTSELQSLMRTSNADFCLNKKKNKK